MKAIAVHPGKADSIHLEDIPKPSVDDVPGGRGVLVRVLRVGVDGTDKEINAAEYGAAPEGDDYLIIGHENFGVVEEVGPNVPDTIRPGGYVVASVRRPGGSIFAQIVASLPRPPYRNAGLVEQLGGAYYSTQDHDLGAISEERGPFDLIMDATGFSPVVWEAAEVLGKNGVLVLSSITGGGRKAQSNSDRINQGVVPGHKDMVRAG